MARKKVCWNITTRCNQNCKYCHRFLNIEDLKYENNKKILQNLIQDGITEITWTGGEALLYPNIINLMKLSKESGIKNKLITNGILLSQSNNKDEICNNLDCLVLSIDSIDNQTNLELGRGMNHFNIIKNILEYVKDEKLKINININTVINRKNINQLEELGKFLNNYPINTWKFFRFMPLRENAEKNRKLFEITDNEFEKQKNKIRELKNIKNVQYKEEKEIEESILILANGNIVKTEDGNDIIKGNALYQNLTECLQGGKKMEKIRTVVAHNNEKIRNAIVNSINTLNYVEVVGVAENGLDTYNKILELKPEMVFSKYEFQNISVLEIMKKSKEKLNENIPVFNVIVDNISEDILKEAVETVGDKMNALVREPYQDRVINILEEYKAYMKK